MVLVRLVFQAKWGKAAELAETLVEAKDKFGEEFGRTRILTDLSGPFHTVVQETEVESLGEWERNRGEIFSHPEFQKMATRAAELMESGRTEFYTIEE